MCFFFPLLLPLVFVCFFKAPLQAANYRVYIKRTGRALYAINSTWWMLLTIWLDFNGFYLDCVGCTYTVFACVLATAEDRRQNLCRRGSKMVAVKTVRVIVIFFFFPSTEILDLMCHNSFATKRRCGGGYVATNEIPNVYQRDGKWVGCSLRLRRTTYGHIQESISFVWDLFQ